MWCSSCAHAHRPIKSTDPGLFTMLESSLKDSVHSFSLLLFVGSGRNVNICRGSLFVGASKQVRSECVITKATVFRLTFLTFSIPLKARKNLSFEIEKKSPKHQNVNSQKVVLIRKTEVREYRKPMILFLLTLVTSRGLCRIFQSCFDIFRVVTV